MLRYRTGLWRTSRRTVLVGLASVLAAAGLASPIAAMADPHPTQKWAKAAQALPGSTAVTATQAKAGPKTAPSSKRLAKPGTPPTGTTGRNGPQLADGADPGKNGDGYVSNEYDLQMTYKGGQESTGVISGPPKVYLVVWGSQWGTSSTDANGDVVMSKDADQAVPYQQDFFKGLGSSGDGWSAVLTQYCEGIQAGAVQCPASAAHIQYPTPGSVLAGVWVDNAAAAPQAASEPELGAEALAAAKHFGNLTQAQNSNVQYIIDSPQGTDPDKWRELGYCAWHDFQRSQYGSLAYTNMPYLTDVAGCGTNWFGENTARGRLDGYGIIGGHEYAETLTDPNTPGGWTDATGQEVADKCAWIPYGANGGLFFENLSTGSFPLQTLWSNTDHLCQSSDPVVTGPALTLKPMCDHTDAPGRISIPAVATDSAGSSFTYSATGLPAGLTIDPASGVISGSNSGTNGWQRITVNSTDAGGRTASTGFWENVTSNGQTGCNGIEQLINPGFENGSADVDHTVMTDSWSPSGYNVITPSSLHAPRTGSWYAWLGQDGSSSDDSITTYLNTYPGYQGASFSFWLDTESTNTSGSSPDTLTLQAISQYTGQVLGTVHTWSSTQGANSGYQFQSVDLTPFIGQVGWGTTIGLKLVSHETGATPQTAFLIDDASAREH
ncbi:Ig domain-containing protein [Kitasatospora sp. NPDC058965]|uniref:Ig domain-containing protein n=1 Tax=Kitasatospora sp. NPDC058965 TaxID=3346682 RepID=UPI0036B71D0A